MATTKAPKDVTTIAHEVSRMEADPEAAVERALGDVVDPSMAASQ